MTPTPGPWAVLDKTGKRFNVKIIHPELGTIATVHTPRSWAEASATAQLLANAPALLQLVQETFTPGWERDNGWVGRAHAILCRLEVNR